MFNVSGGFRGCSRGQLPPPPFMMKTRLGAPFSARRAPLILAQMHSFFAIRSGCGKRVNQGVIQLKNQRICPKERPKNFCAPSVPLLFTMFLAPTLQIAPPSTSGWIRPCSMLQLKESGDLVLFAGSTEDNQDGPASTCSFKQSLGISTEFDGVVYVCDPQTNSIKLLTRMKHCSMLLNAINGLYNAFSMHKKGATYIVKSLSEAVALVRICQSSAKE